MKTLLSAILVSLLACVSAGVQGAAAPTAVGEITFAEGLTSAQRPGQAMRLLAKDDVVNEGEVITTNSRGYAVLALKDGTRITLRPDTSFAVDQLSQRPGEENLAMRLLRGGLRTVTGLISKSGVNRARLGTPTATIGIRGTEFDARICGPECQVEARGVRTPVSMPAAEPVVARVVLMRGDASARSTNGAMRGLAPGAALYNGESIVTGADSHAVLAFRDRSKVTVVASSEFKLEDVRFAPNQPDQGSFVVRVVTGGLRALTGLMGRRDPRSVRIYSLTSTIGIRGTGVDVRTTAQRDYAYTWEGAVGMEAKGSEVLIERDRAAAMEAAGAGPALLAAVPQFFLDETAPRPDQVDVDFDQLFTVRLPEVFPPGLYVGVRGGNVNVQGRGGYVDLGPYEAAQLADGTDRPVLIAPPEFLFGDRVPTPDDDGFRPRRQIELYGPGMGAESLECIVQ